MRKAFVPFVLVVFAFFSLGFLFSQQNQEEAKFQKTVDSYLDAYWKFYPTAATLAGFHNYDAKLEDLSGKNIERHQDDLDLFTQELVTKVDKTKLGAEGQIDYDILRSALELEVMRHENLVPWEYNPLFYNEILLNCIRGLLVKESAPIDARVKNATQRAKLLPGLIKQAKENLKTPPQIYTETAIKQVPGIIDFYKNEAPKLMESASPEAKTGFQAEMVKVNSALGEYQGFLQTQLLPKSTGNFRLGEQAHARLLSLTSEFSIPPVDLVARAKADYNNIRREMFLVCTPFYRIMYPDINLEQMTTQREAEEVRNIVISGVLDKIKAEHPTRENFIEQAKGDVETLKKFIAETKLIDLPEASLAIETMPPAERGVCWTRLLAPGPYESATDYVVEIAPLPDDWTPEQATSLLEEYTNFYSYFWTVRNIFPGLFVPTAFTQKNSSLIRKIYPSLPIYKGWPAYVEEMLINAGFGSYDLRLRLNQLKSQLKIVMDFNLELNIHEGGMTKEQAVQYLTRGGFQTPQEAEMKWNRILLKPCDTAYAYIGLQEIYDMEKDYRKLKGDAFSKKDFLQKLLSFGNLSLRQLKLKMAQ